MTGLGSTSDPAVAPAERSGLHDARKFADLLSARRYSSFVRSMRVALPSLALMTLGVVLIWPGLQNRVGGLILSFAHADHVNSELRMVSPRLTGADKDGRAYTVTADSATPERNDMSRIKMEKVDGDMTLSDGTWVNMTSPYGVYDKLLRRMELSGPISVHTDRGYEMSARSALVDMGKSSITSDEPVALQGSFGTLEADRGRLEDRGRHIYFDGHVRGQFIQSKPKGRQ